MASHSAPKGSKKAIGDDVYRYFSGAMAFVVGLAWNAAFQKLFADVPWLKTWGPFAYALLMTLLACVLVVAVRQGVNESRTLVTNFKHSIDAATGNRL